MCWDYEQIICKQNAMITMVILLGWTGDVHIAPLCFNTCREVCSSFMSSSLSPSQNCTPQFCFAFIQTLTTYLYHQTIISMKAELIFSSAYWRKAQWLPVVGTSLCTTEGSMSPAAREPSAGRHRQSGYKTCTCSGLLHCAAPFTLPWSFGVQRGSC